jgi:hypothetical protein
MVQESQVQSLLNQVQQIVKTHKEHANKQGEDFNIFSILRMENKEVETHSHFIYELLNPKGKHGQGSIFLKSFAKIVLGSEVSNTTINPQREDLTAENRRIDFTLETEKNIFGIEMKIHAGDQENQLYDYMQELKIRAKRTNKDVGVKLFYLTLFRDEASEYSSKKDNKKVKYKCISFATEILDWINDCIKQSAEKSVLREALIQYKILIEKLTGQNMDTNTEIARLIGKNIENFKVAVDFEKGFIQAKINFQIKFWEDLLEELDENNGFYFGNEYKDEGMETIKKACKKYYNGKKSNTQQGIIYDFDNFRIMLIVNHNIYFCIKQNKDAGSLKELKNNIPINNGNVWFYPQLKSKLNFREFNNNLIDELSGDNRAKNIKNLANEFIELVKQLEQVSE